MTPHMHDDTSLSIKETIKSQLLQPVLIFHGFVHSDPAILQFCIKVTCWNSLQAYEVNVALKRVSFINFYKPTSIFFQFIFNLMACGKGNGNQPIEDFIVHSPAPVDMAAKMSAIYNELSFKV